MGCVGGFTFCKISGEKNSRTKKRLAHLYTTLSQRGSIEIFARKELTFPTPLNELPVAPNLKCVPLSKRCMILPDLPGTIPDAEVSITSGIPPVGPSLSLANKMNAPAPSALPIQRSIVSIPPFLNAVVSISTTV